MDSAFPRARSAAALIDEFNKIAGRSPLGVPFHFRHVGAGVRTEHLVIGFITHGNELGTLPAAVRLARELKEGMIQPAGPTSILLGNTEACLKDVRFIEEDFNRVFTFDRPAESLERRRAEEVRPLLDTADFFLDFHQTQTPTESSFWTFPWEGDLGEWARLIAAAPLGLTRAPGGKFSQGTCCLDEYVRGRGKRGLTAELGSKGWDDEQAQVAYDSSVRLIQAYDEVCTGSATVTELSAQQPEISWYGTKDIVPAASVDHRLRPGIGNWTPVKAGELLSAAGEPEVRASVEGRILFPKYPKPGDPPPPELFRLGVPIDDPSTLVAP